MYPKTGTSRSQDSRSKDLNEILLGKDRLGIMNQRVVVKEELEKEINDSDSSNMKSKP